MKLFDLKQLHAQALNKADSILRAAESAGRELTDAESMDVDTCMAAVASLKPQIDASESQNSIRKMFGKSGLPTAGSPLLAAASGSDRWSGGSPGGATGLRFKQPEKRFAAEYPEAFFDYIASEGKRTSAALYEGSNPAGGYAVPVVVDDQIVPLAPHEMTVRSLANVIPTTSDIKFPRKSAFGTAAAKSESGSSANSFAGTAPTLDQFTLSAFMAGVTDDVSWELAQDVPSFQAFVMDDMILAQQMYEENLYINGTGSGQAQGLIGNVGAGVTEEPDASGNLVSINGTLDLTGALNAVYHPNASWLMNRATSIIIRKAQTTANLFNPAWTRVGTQDYLHGYPVAYSAYMPNAARSVSPVLFGDFKRGYIIGDRGGSGINVKVLDQPKALQGLLTLLVYRRTDGRVRRSEAIQSYNVAAS
jgi:HK97 family phage major capsid protein